MVPYIVIAALIVAIIVAKSIYDKKTRHSKLVAKLDKAWGDVPSQGFSPEKMKSIGYYYRLVGKGENDVDDITWNDLDMDQVFMTINNTASAIGEEYLYAMLHMLRFEDKELIERNRLIELFRTNRDARLLLQEAFTNMGKTRSISVYEYINRLNDIRPESNANHITKIILLLCAIACIFYNPLPGIIATLVIIGVNMVTYFKRKNEIESYFTIVSYIIRWLDSIKQIGSMDIPEIKEYSDKLLDISKAFKKFRSGATVVASKNNGGDLLQTFVDYFRMMFHLDLIKFNKMLEVFRNQKNELNRMFKIVGILDSSIAIASFRELMADYCIPELSDGKKLHLHAKQVYHPILNDPVKNDIYEDRCVLVTGSNASGKSTFIKTLAINAILAQTIYTAICDSYKASYFKVISSMALQDDLQGGESYYIVEIKSLKRIIDSSADSIPTLCFVDEVLRGTNTLERVAASSRILYSLAKSNCMCFAATHDIELTYILNKYYSNYHFQEQVIDDGILFDYTLHEGRAVSKNAIRLLSMIGYSDNIIEDANKAANDFLEKGEWNEIA